MLTEQKLSEWEFFVFRHQNKGNLWFHFISYFSVPIVIYLSLVFHSYYYLLLFPVSQYVGYLGHQVFERSPVRSRDLLSPMTTVHLTRIWFLILKGQYFAEVARVNEKVGRQNRREI